MRAILQYIPRNMQTVFALLCFVVVIHWLIFPYPSGFLHWHCGNLTIAPVPANQPWWIWINTSCQFIMNDCITTTKQSTTKPCAYFLGYTVLLNSISFFLSLRNLLRSTHKIVDTAFHWLDFFADEYCKARYTKHLALNHAASINEYYYDDVIMTTLASQITSFTVVYSTVHSDADQRKHQSSASLAFVWGIHRDRWIPRTKGQLRGKCFHLMTS